MGALRRTADHRPHRGARLHRRGRMLVAGAAVALAASGAAVVTSLPASAAGATITSPRVVYTPVGQPLAFSGSDDVSKLSRVISVDGNDPGTCNPTSGNNYVVSTCGRVQISLTDIYGGSLRITGSTKVSTPGGDRYIASGAVVENVTDPAQQGGAPVLSISMNGQLGQLNAALADLEYLPAAGYENAGSNVPNIDILYNDGLTIDSDNEVVLRVEGVNGGPTVAGPGTVLASAGVQAEYPPDPGPGDPEPQLVSVIDPELCKNDPQNICGGAYPTGNPPPESDDQLLLLAWIQEQDCGTFDLRSRSGFTNQGGAALPSVNSLLTAATGLDLTQVAANAVLATLSPAAVAVDLAPQASGLTTVFAGTASLDSIRYALSQITFAAPPDDTTCNLYVAVSDLGNNGMPKEWKPGPGPDTLLDSYEIPNALADQQVVTFEVKDTSPDVEVSSLLPGPTSVAGPDKDALFQVSFSEDVSGFDDAATDLEFATGNGKATGITASITAVPGDASSYVVKAEATADGDITLSIPAGAATAVAAPNGASDASTGDATIEWDQTKPTATIAAKAGQADPTNTSPVRFVVETDETFSSAPASFTGADIDLAGSTAATGSVSVTWLGVSDAKKFEVVVPVTGSGTVVAKVAAGAFTDLALNENEESAEASVEVDLDGPTVSIDVAPGQVTPTSDSQIDFEVTFSEDVTGFATDDLTISGGAGATTALVTPVSGSVYTVTLSGMTQGGSVTLAVKAAAVADALGNPSKASPAAATVDYQVPADPAPTVAVQVASGQADPVVGADVGFTVTFSEPVTGFGAAGDVTLGGTALPTGLVFTPVSGSVYTVTATGMSTNGTVTLGVKAGAALDSANQPNEASPSTATANWQAAPDTTNPTVADIDRLQPSPAKGPTVSWSVEWSEPVTGFDLADISTAGSTAPGTLAVQVTPAGPASVYTVTVSGMTGPGTVVIGFPAGAAQDLAGNQSEAPNDPDTSVVFDNQRPSVTVNQAAAQADPTSGSSLVFDVVFSEDVTGFNAADLAVTSSAGSLAADVQGGPAAYTVTLTGMSQTGSVSVGVVDGAGQDQATNTSTASTSVDNTVQWNAPAQPDNTPPTVTVNQGASQNDPSSALALVFDVQFSEPVIGFATGDVTLGGTAGATTAVVSGSGAIYTVTVTGMTQSGTVVASVAAGKATDGSGNPNGASTSTDNTVQWNAPAQPDNTPPTVTVNQGAGQADPTSGSAIVFDVVFSEPVLGFATGDVTLGGTAGATAAAVSGSGATYTVTVTGMQQSGTVVASVAAGKATDTSLNPNVASTSTDNTVQWNAPAQPDNVPPTVTVNQAAGQVDPTTGSPILFTVVFSEPVLGFATGDVTLGGTAGATAAVVSGGGATYTVSVTGMQQSGTVVVSVGAGVATDGAGNPNAASTSTDNTVQWNAPAQPDNVPPTVTVNQAAGQVDPTTGSTILFTVVFSEPVTGFATGDVTLGGTAGATTAAVSGGPTTYTVTVSGMSQSGTVTVSVPAGVAQDGSANPNTASTSTDNTVQWNAPANPPNPPSPGGSQALATPGGTVTLTYPAGTTLQSFTTSAPQVPPPAGVTFPYGQLSFTATTAPNGLVTFTLTLPGPVNAFYKLFGQTWLAFTWNGETGAQVNGSTVTVTIRDNGRGDSNPAVGIVSDPAAPAVVVAQLPGTGTDPAVPVTAGVLLLLAGLAVLHLSRRRATA